MPGGQLPAGGAAAEPVAIKKVCSRPLLAYVIATSIKAACHRFYVAAKAQKQPRRLQAVSLLQQLPTLAGLSRTEKDNMASVKNETCKSSVHAADTSSNQREARRSQAGSGGPADPVPRELLASACALHYSKQQRRSWPGLRGVASLPSIQGMLGLV